MFRPIAHSLALAVMLAAAPAGAQVTADPYAPNGETAAFTGPWKRYQTHVLKLAADRYAVLFRPGFIDREGAIRAIRPLCAALGKTAVGTGPVAPVELLFDIETGPSVHQGYQVVCN